MSTPTFINVHFDFHLNVYFNFYLNVYSNFHQCSSQLLFQHILLIFHFCFYPNVKLYLQFFILFTLTKLFDIAPKNNFYLLIAWNVEDKQLVKEIFTILKENSIIQKRIWPRKRENFRKKSKIAYFKILTQKPFQNKPQIKDFLKEKKALTHYKNAVQNQVA